jgi:hypothetical protein
MSPCVFLNLGHGLMKLFNQWYVPCRTVGRQRGTHVSIGVSFYPCIGAYVIVLCFTKKIAHLYKVFNMHLDTGHLIIR